MRVSGKTALRSAPLLGTASGMFFRACLLLLLSALPTRADTVEVGSAAGLTFGRDAVTAYLSIHKDGKPLRIDADNRIRNYLRGVFEFDGKAHILVYNTAENVPSGRALSRGEEGNDVVVVSEQDGRAVFQRVADVPLGIDFQMRTAEVRGDKIVCGNTACLVASASWFSDPTYSVVRMPPDTEIVELAGDRVLLQTVYNDQIDGRDIPSAETSIFTVCIITDPVEDCTDVPPSVVPFDLKPDGTYRVMDDPEAVLRFDYDRLGLANYSEPNLEARIAWSNVYFLCGLAALHDMPIDGDFKAEVKARLVREFEAIARVGETAYPGFKVRRYSMDREPVDFLLHLSRIAKTVERARPVIGDALADRILKPVLPQVRNPTGTVETIAAKPRTEIQYRDNMPFWADGANVPWNYQNAWIEAVSLTGVPADLRKPIAAMIETFVGDERLRDKPLKWSYAGGVFGEGWAEGVSSNTPSWMGDNASNVPAHISYRSMDALALFEAEKAGLSVPAGINVHFLRLIASGHLYPFVNEALESHVDIPFHIARHYARSSLPWQFQNQVWAFNSLRRLSSVIVMPDGSARP